MSTRAVMNAVGFLIAIATAPAFALEDTDDELADAVNFRAYSPTFAGADVLGAHGRSPHCCGCETGRRPRPRDGR